MLNIQELKIYGSNFFEDRGGEVLNDLYDLVSISFDKTRMTRGNFRND